MKSRSPQVLIFLTIFIDLLGFGIVLPIASYIAEGYANPDHKQAMIGMLMASYSLMQVIFSPIWGRLSDKIGRRPILLMSLFGSVVSYSIFALASSYWMLLAGRTFAGIFAANITVAQAYMADVTPPEKRTGAMGMIGAAFGLGFAIGPVFGAVMARFGNSYYPDLPKQLFPGLTAAAICLLNFLWALRALPESLSAEVRGKVEPTRRLASFSEVGRSLGHPIVGPLVGVFFFATLGFANLEVALGLYAKLTPALKLDIEHVYDLFIFVGLFLAFMHGYVARKLVKFVPESTLVVVGAFTQAIGLMMFPAVASIPWILFVMAIIAFGQGICAPCLLALVSQATSATRQGAVLGVTQSASSFARIIGPLFAMGMWRLFSKKELEGSGLSAPFVAGGIIMLVAVAMAVVTRRRLMETPAIAEPGEAG